jgi:hypothetical protein
MTVLSTGHPMLDRPDSASITPGDDRRPGRSWPAREPCSCSGHPTRPWRHATPASSVKTLPDRGLGSTVPTTAPDGTRHML